MIGVLSLLKPRDLDSEEPIDPSEKELLSSWAIFIFVSLLIGTLWCSYYLQRKQIRAVHETVVAIFGGKSILLFYFILFFYSSLIL